jgi:hypothetical protein
MYSEAVVNMAFAELESDEALDTELSRSGSYTLYSSGYLIECQLDNIDTRDFCDDFENRTRLEIDEDGGITLSAERAHTGGVFGDEDDIWFGRINIKEPSNLDNFTLQTEVSCTGVAELWLTGNGYLRLQLDMQPYEDEDPVSIMWSEIHYDADHDRRVRKLEKTDEGFCTPIKHIGEDYEPNEEVQEPHRHRDKEGPGPET